MIWVIAHYFTQKYIWLKGQHDISEIAMVVNYILFLTLYAAVIKLAIKGEIHSIWRGWIIPILAMIGAGIIILSGFQNELFIWFLVFCAIVMGSAWLFAVKHPEIETVNLEEIDLGE